MSCCHNQTEAVCPCATFVHPRVIFNPPGLDALSYRVGDYTTFRRALLQARPDETELSRDDGSGRVQIWRPGGSGDLAVQMMEWWAYLADILTFYNERVASQAYLWTADLPENVSRLIRLLGYRPRPGIGATGVLAALANGPKAFTLPQGFQIQSKPGPGQQPQVFELTADTKVGGIPTGALTGPQGEMGAAPAPDSAQITIPNDPKDPNYKSVLLKGTLSALKKGDRILFLRNDDSPPLDKIAVATVFNVSHEKDSQTGAITRIQCSPNDDLSKVDDVTTFRLLKGDQTVQVWQYPAGKSKVIRKDTNGSVLVDLETIVRGIKQGDLILFESSLFKSSPPVRLVKITGSTEIVWYANPKSYTPPGPPSDAVDPSIPPDPKVTPPFPIPHTSIVFPVGSPITELSDNNDSMPSRAKILIRYGWKDVGPLIAPSPLTIGGNPNGLEAASAISGTVVTLLPVAGASFPKVLTDTQVLVEDANGNGDTGILDTASNLTLDDPVPTLVPPLRVLFNLLPVTRGKTVSNEVLGNGNAALAGQDFVLQNAPVTYLQSPESVSGDDYSSTVRAWVNGLEWKEVRSFYGLPADAQAFVTEEDEQGKTHVLFGDGENGARLPTGVNNVTTSYRYGSGAQAPDAGSLTVVLKPQPGLKAIRNPVQVDGGSDPDAPSKVRKLAPRSVLTFNRAVSADDYETIAAQAPGVTRARASFTFDAAEQRPRVKIWVGDSAGAVDSARKAIAATADPNRLPAIELATKIPITLSLTLLVDPRRDAQTVLNAVHDALLDPDKGLFGVNVVGIGQAFYDSQIYAACLRVPGVQAIHDISFSPEVFKIQSAALGDTLKFAAPKKFSLSFQTKAAFRSPFQLQAQSGIKRFAINPSFPHPQFTSPACRCEHRHDPGEGGFFFLADDGKHLTLTPAVAQ